MKAYALAMTLIFGGGLPAVASADTNCFGPPTAECMTFGPHRLPTSVAAFEGLQRTFMTAPDEQMRAVAGAALFVYAAMVRTYDDVLGKALLVLALDPSGRAPGKVHGGQSWSRANDYYIHRREKRPGLVGSYAIGADPAADYAVKMGEPIGLRFRKQSKYVGDPTKGSTKVFVCTAGAKTCRPMNVKRDAQGVWRVTGFSSFTVGF